MLKLEKLILLMLTLSLLASCGKESVFQDQVDFKDRTWAADENIQFEFNIPDTSKSYNLIYTLRNGLDYPYYNLYLQYNLKDSSGASVDQNLQELILMDKKTGKPYGSGFGDNYDHKFVSIRNMKFPYAGKFYFNIVHYMRLDNLPEIYSIGLHVEESD